MLDEHRWLPTARLGDATTSRTLLHVATDWPGHLPGVGATIATLVAHGADVDARGFKQWNAARRLLDRGAATTLIDAATLGLDDRVAAALAASPAPSADEIDLAFWSACHGGRRGCAEALLSAAGTAPRPAATRCTFPSSSISSTTGSRT